MANVMCNVRRLSVDVDQRLGVLITPAMNHPDMTRTIQLFKSIDEEVRQIQVFEEDRLDIVYFINDEGNWESRRF